MKHYLAQLNLAKAKFPIDDPRMKEFVDLLSKVNAVGETSKGFVWILKDETGTAVNFNLFNNALLLVNMTVWETWQDLKNFAFHGAHGDVFRRRKEWFDPMDKESTVLWWINKGHIPSVNEGKEKIQRLWNQGASPQAFSLKKIFDPPL